MQLDKKQIETFILEAKKILSGATNNELLKKTEGIKTKQSAFNFSISLVKKGFDGQKCYQLARSILTQREIGEFSTNVTEISNIEFSMFQKKVKVMLNHKKDFLLLKKALKLKTKKDIYLFITKNLTTRFETHRCYKLLATVMTGREIKKMFFAANQAYNPIISHAIGKF